MGNTAAEQKTMVSSRYLAELFGLSSRRIQQLKEDGIIDGTGRPIKYDLFPTIKKYIQFLSEKAHGKQKKATDAENESMKLEAEARYKTAKADMEELKLQELQGTLHSADDVAEITTAHVLDVKAMLQALPNKLAMDLAPITEPAQIAERIQIEVYAMLRDLAAWKYDSESYKKRVQQRTSWINDSDNDG